MLTREEKIVVVAILARRDDRLFWWDYLPYLAPPIVLAAYGLWVRDIGTVFLAFVLLLFFSVWYVVRQKSMAHDFTSAVRKYENAVRALEKPDAPPP